jgi:hypothetical protein
LCKTWASDGRWVVFQAAATRLVQVRNLLESTLCWSVLADLRSSLFWTNFLERFQGKVKTAATTLSVAWAAPSFSFLLVLTVQYLQKLQRGYI